MHARSVHPFELPREGLCERDDEVCDTRDALVEVIVDFFESLAIDAAMQEDD